jgi:hypothetical protein
MCEKKRTVTLQAERLFENVNAVWKVGEGLWYLFPPVSM